MLYQAPFDPKELLVVGVNAHNAKSRLQEAVNEQYPGYRITTDSIKSYRGHTTEFTRDEEKIAFSVIKTNFVPSAAEYVEVSTATCELILEGESVDRRTPSTNLYAFAPAHLVLEEKDFEKLNDKDVQEGTAGHVQGDLAGRVLNYRYYLKLFNPTTWARLVKGDVIFSYRQFPRGPRKGEDHFSSFYNDSILLEIQNNTTIPLPTLKTAMQRNQKGDELGGVFPINDGNQLRLMGLNFAKVEVGPSSGYMVCPGTQLRNKNKPSKDDRPQLLHAQFVVTDWLVPKLLAC